jgi:CheY-like chemotaxis protein
MADGGLLSVRLECIEVTEPRRLSHGSVRGGSYVQLSVSDTGTGIPAALIDRIFDPFFTTKGVGEGTGLGLALVHGIVADLGGAIDVATTHEKGTTFTSWLPIDGEAKPLERDVARELPMGLGQTILVVDDEQPLVELAEETLAELGYEAVGFDSSVAALAAFRASPARFDALLTDETMPDLAGTDLVDLIRASRPDIPIVLMSGYAGARLLDRARTVGVTAVLRKPLQRGDIADTFGRIFGAESRAIARVSSVISDGAPVIQEQR